MVPVDEWPCKWRRVAYHMRSFLFDQHTEQVDSSHTRNNAPLFHDPVASALVPIRAQTPVQEEQVMLCNDAKKRGHRPPLEPLQVTLGRPLYSHGWNRSATGAGG